MLRKTEENTGNVELKLCSVKDCPNKHKGLGYCNFHYKRFKAGIPLTRKKRIKDPTRKCPVLDCYNPHWGKGYCKKHYEVYIRPCRSRIKEDAYLQLVMNRVRKRDKHTCQWYGCGKKKGTQVHHIFSRAEYPELKYVEKYMICYCRFHHREWHKKRGDVCYYRI